MVASAAVLYNLNAARVPESVVPAHQPVQHTMTANTLCCTARQLFVQRLARLTQSGSSCTQLRLQVKQPGLHMTALLLLNKSFRNIVSNSIETFISLLPAPDKVD